MLEILIMIETRLTRERRMMLVLVARLVLVRAGGSTCDSSDWL